MRSGHSASSRLLDAKRRKEITKLDAALSQLETAIFIYPRARLANCAEECAPGQSVCCAQQAFIDLGREKAASYLAANDARIRRLVEEGLGCQRKQC